MNDVIRDIEVLENLLIAFQEGASDEKRMAVNAVERLLKEKQKIVDDFEKEFCDDTTETIAA
jgi:replicative superfamily II helicase